MDGLFKLWSDSLRLGMAATGCPEGSVPSLGVPFYGWLFRKGDSPFLGGESAEPFDDAEESFVAEALDEEVADLSEVEWAELGQRGKTLGPPGVLPPSLLRGVACFDDRWGGGKGLLLVGVLRQVYAYLYRRDAGDVIRQIVLDEVADDTRVLVGHSLGSVVVYDLVRRGLTPAVTTLVTLGSPLAFGTVRRALAASANGTGVGEVRWSNVHDPWDVVTAGRGLAPRAIDCPVDNGRVDPHALTRYLGRKETGTLILAGTSNGGAQ
ncbi:MAG: hypothetical protein EOO27_01845 [Comamonadaceae bacterium]|nr:MAG: hypothetical protein EOO27_01845 [Comamonadaceae bacterium]